jgi:hypothetical protein
LVDRPGDGEGKEGYDQPYERHPDPPYDPSGTHYAKTNNKRDPVLVPKIYAPECVEGEFCELRLAGLLRSWVNGKCGWAGATADEREKELVVSEQENSDHAAA